MKAKHHPTTAPSDEACGKAWDRIMEVARAHALIVSAYGGVATLATPEEQRNAGIRQWVLVTHVMNETEEQGNEEVKDV